MNNGKRLFFIILIFGMVCSLYAGDDYKQPRAKEVVLVVRVVMSPPINDGFYSKFWDIDSKSITTKRDRSSREGETLPSTAFLNTGNSVWSAKGLALDAVGSIASATLDIPKDRQINLNTFLIYPAGHRLFQFKLPLFATITVPEGANYLYLGTFVYKWEGNQFTLTDVNRIDEFDDAREIVKERYGSDANLTRVPLKEQKEEE